MMLKNDNLMKKREIDAIFPVSSKNGKFPIGYKIRIDILWCVCARVSKHS